MHPQRAACELPLALLQVDTIPTSEVIVVFDADMNAKPEFFLKVCARAAVLLRYCAAALLRWALGKGHPEGAAFWRPGSLLAGPRSACTAGHGLAVRGWIQTLAPARGRRFWRSCTMTTSACA
jgi:hypothetical protein